MCLFRNWGKRTSALPEVSSATSKSSVKAAPRVAEENSFSGEQLGLGGEFCLLSDSS